MKKLLAVSVLLAVVGCYGDNFLRFKPFGNNNKATQDVLRLLRHNHPPERFQPLSYFHKFGINPAQRLTGFTFENCGNPKTEWAILKSLSLKPDPVRLPGDITVSFDLNVIKGADSPIMAVVNLEKKVLGEWITIPCVDNIGSCTYEDFCGILNQIPQCPDPFSLAGIPCKCPFPQGNYHLPPTDFTVDISILPSGDYKAKINMTKDDNVLTCIQVNLSLS